MDLSPPRQRTRSRRVWLLAGLAVLVGLSFTTRAIMERGDAPAKPSGSRKAERLPFFRDLPPVLNIAHRGASTRAPEHSLPAYELAVAQGAQVLELDLRRTRDDVLLVAHDADLVRTSGLDVTLAEVTWSELRALAGDLTPLPLDEVLERFAAAHFNLEIKDDHLGAARTLAQRIAERRVEGRVLVASRHGRVLEEFRRASAGRVATSASLEEALQFRFCHLLGWTCDAEYAVLQLPALDWLGVTGADFIRYAHQQGLLVHFWTIDDPSLMERLLLAGADGIMTNHPDRLAAVLDTIARAR